MFDAHLCIHHLDDVDLDNLAYFGLRRAVLVMEPNRLYASADALCGALKQHARDESERMRMIGIEPIVAAGATPENAPERAVPEYYARLEELVESGNVQVIGPLGWRYGDPWEADLFRRHAAIAERHDLPIYVRWDRYADRAADAMEAVLTELELRRDRVFFVNVPLSAVRELVIVQRPMVVAIPPGGVDVEELSYWIERSADICPILLGSSLGVATVDVVAFAQLYRDLARRIGQTFSPDTRRLLSKA